MTIERELGWNDEISNDGGDFEVLPGGEYRFTVTNFERGRFNGSAKLPPCNMAKLTLDCDDDQGNQGTITENLFLHSKTEGLLCQFFRSIGARQHGQRVAMDWSRVIGAGGRCKISVRKYTGRDGQERDSNDVKFLDPPEPEQQQQQQQNQPAGAMGEDDIPF